VIAQLVARLGRTNASHEREDLIPLRLRRTAALKQLPRIRAFPRTAADVSAVLNLAREHNVPVVTRGSGTGLSGGSVPVSGALVLCLVRMDGILELDAKNLTLRAEAGVITQRIFESADGAGLFYRPIPAR